MRYERSIAPERLDALPCDDPRARRSRRDLRRVHRAMRSLSILRRAVSKARPVPPRRILELGAGDGTLLLRLALASRPRWESVEATLLDRQDLVSAATKSCFAAIGWRIDVLCTDVIAWAEAPHRERYDLCLATLFLHHFRAPALAVLLRAVCATADAFIACEPRRNGFSRLGSHLIGALGVNDVTREDAITSVAAGFNRRELTSLWPPTDAPWRLEEYPAWPFTHCFVARRP